MDRPTHSTRERSTSYSSSSIKATLLILHRLFLILVQHTHTHTHAHAHAHAHTHTHTHTHTHARTHTHTGHIRRGCDPRPPARVQQRAHMPVHPGQGLEPSHERALNLPQHPEHAELLRQKGSIFSVFICLFVCLFVCLHVQGIIIFSSAVCFAFCTIMVATQNRVV